MVAAPLWAGGGGGGGTVVDGVVVGAVDGGDGVVVGVVPLGVVLAATTLTASFIPPAQ